MEPTYYRIDTVKQLTTFIQVNNTRYSLPFYKSLTFPLFLTKVGNGHHSTFGSIPTHIVENASLKYCKRTVEW